MRYLLLLLALAFAPAASAWNKMGHMEVAAIAYARLTPQVRTQADQLLTLNPAYAEWTGTEPSRNALTRQRAFMRAAAWPDDIKTAPGYTDEGDRQDAPYAGADQGYADHLRHRYWHIISLPFSTDGTPLKPPPVPNVLTQITSLSAVLADPAASPDRKSYALTWLLHLVGDVHQPLHTVSRFTQALPDGDAAGNKAMLVCPPEDHAGPPAHCERQLHAFWDDLAGDEEGLTDYVPGALRHVRELPPADARLARIGDPQIWVNEGVQLAQGVVYTGPAASGAGPYVLDAAYEAQARQLAGQRLALAGARLARLLNQQLR
jgi:hypothetical protein